jgi:1-phosphofructokinase family hexose kinase
VIVCVAANPSIDKLFEVDRLLVGQIHRPGRFVQTAGGKGLNVARVARGLGAEVRLAAILRGHAGTWLEESLLADGIAGAFVRAEGETRSSLSVADREGGTLTEFYESGPVTSEAVWINLMEATSRLFIPGGILTISGSMPEGLPQDGYRGLVAAARAAGMWVAIDVAGDPLRLALEAHPEIAKSNVQEVSELLGESAAGPEDSRAAAAKLRELSGGMGHAGIVTRGADGVTVAAPDGTVYEGLSPTRGPYPVGSGDAFLAGLVVGLERTAAWPDALRLALGAAAANADVPGAGTFDPSTVDGLAARATVRRISSP